ncbi:DUF4384 domain-containing protein [Tropicimonas sp. S265A]|uniref:DUF4384 domain-containing protein n=1 Tax=Tropicimonas sp. S265A TaxID=3415134 RepID=UPI003C798C0F
MILQTAQVPQTQAVVRDAESDAAPETTPAAGVAVGDLIPKREARSATPDGASLSAARPPSGNVAAEVATQSAPAVARVSAPEKSVLAIRQSAPASKGIEVAAAVLPQLAPDVGSASATGVSAPGARQGALPDARVASAMAWSGAGQLALDSAGLLALTAFVAPQQAGQKGEDLRDSVFEVLSSVPCARLQTAFNAETGALELRGHLPDAGLRSELTAALRAQIGDTLAVEDSLQLLPEPQCGTLGKLDALGLPQSEEQFTDPYLVGANLFAREYVFRDGDRMVIDLEGADYPAYIYLDYYDADGNVLHLIPNDVIGLRRFAPEESFSIGAAGSGLELIVQPPLGQDIAVAIASDTPLYDGLRPFEEPAAEYLEFLKSQVAAVAPDRAEWVYFFVESVAGN